MYANFNEIAKRIENNKFTIAVVGLGYVGLPLALEFAAKKIKISGIEIDQGRLRHIQNQESYITDVTSKELIRALNSGYFSVSADFKLLKKADVIIICVPTPLKRKYDPDISYISQAVKSISKNMNTGTLVILESTTYPGTTEEVILPLLEISGKKHGKDFYLSFSPERIDPGNKRYPVRDIPKVVGGLNSDAAKLAALVYKKIINKVVLVSSTRAAEFTKLLENTFRLVNISMIDELAMMADKMRINIWEVIQAASTKPFGFMPFYPGPGVGGHCIPKDPLYLYWKAKKSGFHSRFIKLSSEMINYMPRYVVERVSGILAKERIPLSKARVLVVGVTYKKDVHDLRKSPALDIIEILEKEGTKVSYYDPLIPYLKINRINLKSIKLGKKILGSFDCALVATGHSNINYAMLLANSRRVFDTRNVYGHIKNKKVILL